MRTSTVTRTASGRRALVVVMLLAFAFSHLFATANLAGFLGNQSVTRHALLHWQGTPHHHHDDGSVGQDHSVESHVHLSLDACLNDIAVQCAIAGHFGPHPAGAPADRDELSKPWPYLEAPIRPPSFPA